MIKSSSKDEVLASLFVLNAPVPERHFYPVLGGRTVFAKWAKQGLPRYKIDGMRGMAVRPSELRKFLDARKEAAND